MTNSVIGFNVMMKPLYYRKWCFFDRKFQNSFLKRVGNHRKSRCDRLLDSIFLRRRVNLNPLTLNYISWTTWQVSSSVSGACEKAGGCLWRTRLEFESIGSREGKILDIVRHCGFIQQSDIESLLLGSKVFLLFARSRQATRRRRSLQ
jgi:hypothetical protein